MGLARPGSEKSWYTYYHVVWKTDYNALPQKRIGKLGTLILLPTTYVGLIAFDAGLKTVIQF